MRMVHLGGPARRPAPPSDGIARWRGRLSQWARGGGRMQQEILEQPPTDSVSRPRTTSVLALLAGAALTFSYLVSYALTNALVSAGLMHPWAPGHDPRPRRMLVGF